MRKATISFVLSVCLSFYLNLRPSVRPRATTQLRLNGFSRNVIFDCFFFKSVDKIQVSVQSYNNNGTLHEYQYTCMIVSHFFSELEILQTKDVEKIKTKILCSKILFSKTVLFMR